MPRIFDSNDPVDKVIYEEDQDVAEMYFVMEGRIGFAINSFSKTMNKHFYKVARSQTGKQLICDYYVIHKKKSNFIYMAREPVHCYGMDRKFLHKKIIAQFPDVEFHLKLSSMYYYNKLINRPLTEFK